MALTLPSRAAAPSLSYEGPTVAGELGAPPRNEASGIAASRRSPDVLWIHDDSGSTPALYAISTRGEMLGTLHVKNVRNTDWEDLASVTLGHQAWLVIGDTGDNDGRRHRVELHFIEEPSAQDVATKRTLIAVPAATVRVTFSDGARDCESLGIDAKERAVYLLSKRDLVPRLYRAPLPAALTPTTDVVAEFVGLVPELARPTGADAFFAGLFEKGRARPCGMDINAEGTAAVVVTYADVVLYPRAADETWTQAFSRKPVRLGAHSLPQAEAVCFSRDGTAIFVGSEDSKKLLRYDRR